MDDGYLTECYAEARAVERTIDNEFVQALHWYRVAIAAKEAALECRD